MIKKILMKINLESLTISVALGTCLTFPAKSENLNLTNGLTNKEIAHLLGICFGKYMYAYKSQLAGGASNSQYFFDVGLRMEKIGPQFSPETFKNSALFSLKSTKSSPPENIEKFGTELGACLNILENSEKIIATRKQK